MIYSEFRHVLIVIGYIMMGYLSYRFMWSYITVILNLDEFQDDYNVANDL